MNDFYARVENALVLHTEYFYFDESDKNSRALMSSKKLMDCFSAGSRECVFMYDFGDDWLHTIHLENIITDHKGHRTPICTAGAMACPIDDMGGIYGYFEVIKLQKKAKSKLTPDERELLEFYEGFDPKFFRPCLKIKL